MSLNLPAIEVLADVGPASFLARLHGAGAEIALPKDTPISLAIGLGGLGISLVDIARLYAGLARGGEAPALFERLDGASPIIGPKRITDPVAAFYIADILRGSPPPDNSLSGRIAFKTGTSYGFRDALAIEAYRERIAKSIGSAGLERDPPAERIVRRRRTAQDIRDIERRDRIGDALGPDDGAGAVEPLEQRRRLAAAREARVEARDIDERDPQAPQSDRKADRRILGQRDLGPRAVQPRQKSRGADVGEHLDRGKIERHLQRLARRHRAPIAEVEILRRVGAVARGTVEQHRFGMGEPLLERERIDERFQRRAGRARRARHVDRAIALGVGIVSGADPGADFATRVVDDDDRRRKFWPQPLDALLDQGLELGLQPRVERKTKDVGAGVSGDRFLGRVRSQRRKVLARLRNRLAFGGVGFLAGDDSPVGDTVEHAGARALRGFGIFVGTARFRRLRQRHQQRRLGDRQPVRLLAEIGERGGPHALQIAAERREHEIAVEHASFAYALLNLPGARHLPKLVNERALVARFDQPRDLHRQRRAAGDDVAARRPLPRGARHRPDIDALMIIEPAVLVADQHRKVARIDLARSDGQSPASVGQSEGAEQPPVAIDDDGRTVARSRQIERTEMLQIARTRRGHGERQREDGRPEGGEEAALEAARGALIRPSATFSRKSGRGAKAPRPLLRERGWGEGAHFDTTSIVPKPVRPKRSGRYMSSA